MTVESESVRLLFGDGHLDGSSCPIWGFWILGHFSAPEERSGARPFFIQRTSSPCLCPPGVTPFLLFFTVGFSLSVIHRARPYNTFNFKLGLLSFSALFVLHIFFRFAFFILAPAPPTRVSLRDFAVASVLS